MCVTLSVLTVSIYSSVILFSLSLICVFCGCCDIFALLLRFAFLAHTLRTHAHALFRAHFCARMRTHAVLLLLRTRARVLSVSIFLSLYTLCDQMDLFACGGPSLLCDGWCGDYVYYSVRTHTRTHCTHAARARRYRMDWCILLSPIPILLWFVDSGLVVALIAGYSLSVIIHDSTISLSDFLFALFAFCILRVCTRFARTCCRAHFACVHIYALTLPPNFAPSSILS